MAPDETGPTDPVTALAEALKIVTAMVTASIKPPQ